MEYFATCPWEGVGGGGGGGTSRNFRKKCATTSPNPKPDLISDQTCNFPHPISDLASESCIWFANPLPCPSEVNILFKHFIN